MASADLTIYHNPRCTKSREALALLQEKGLEPKVIEYLKTPLKAAQVKALIKKLGVAPHALLRTKEAPYKALGLSKDSTLEEIAQAIEQEPVLMERPVIVTKDKAVIGRPTEKVLEIL